MKIENEKTWNIEKEKGEAKFKINAKRQNKEVEKVGITLGVPTGDMEIEEYLNANPEEKKDDEDVVVYGNIEVNDNEKDILKLPPNHALYPRLNLEEFETEIDKGLAKHTWRKIQVNQHEEKLKRALEGENAVEENLVLNVRKFSSLENDVVENNVRNVRTLLSKMWWSVQEWKLMME